MAPIHLGEIDRYFGQLYEYMTTISDQYRIAGFSLNVQLLFIMLAVDLQLPHYLLEPLRLHALSCWTSFTGRRDYTG